MILLIDNFDSFTYNLSSYFSQLDVKSKILRNDVPVDEVFDERFEGIVLSAGPENPSQAGNMMDILAKGFRDYPILGICLGHQGIGQYFGGNLKKAIRPMHGKISKVVLEKDPLFKDFNGETEVVRYHSLILEDLPSTLKVIAKTEREEIMAIKHREYPITGFQFHPEAAMTQGGLQMLENWVLLNHLSD